jgi:DUF1680 family protein
MPNQPRSSAVVVDTSRSPHARLRSVPLPSVTLADEFWAPRRRINREITLPAQYRLLEETGRLDNFRRAAGKKDIPFQGIFFNDSDVYKWLEAAAWTLAVDPDPALARDADAAIAEIAGAQQPDGYLDTYFTFEKAAERWNNLRDMHELYCAGHLFQAAVAHHRATGSDRLLAVARRLAGHICATLGPAEEGRRPGVCGHPEVEMALVELARETGDPKYLRQAQYFVDTRGCGLIGGSPYHQDHQPFRELERMTGHAVRAVYLNCGAADLCAETGEVALRAALDRLWANMTTRQMYASGGIGPRYEGEAFGKDYELPNERAYAETCAAIGSVMWNWRMLALEGDARYADALELALYNGVLSGLSLDGQNYFYQNPLADDGSHRRTPWFDCACCPPNIARLLASLPGYFCGLSAEGAWVHLYAEGAAHLALPDGRAVALTQRTRYPWAGEIAIKIEGVGEFGLFLRVPAWCERGAALEVNGRPFTGALTAGAYAEIRRAWQPGDIVRLDLPMPVRRVECHPYAAENVGQVALARGPLLYCVEGADNPGLDPRDLVLPADSEITAAYQSDLLGGVVVLRSQAEIVPPDAGWQGRLYRTAAAGDVARRPVEVTATPYYAWANRAPGPLRVWLRTAEGNQR